VLWYGSWRAEPLVDGILLAESEYALPVLFQISLEKGRMLLVS